MNESDDYISIEGINVILRDLPHAVKGFCYHDDDGSDYIVVNAHHTQEQQYSTIQHEIDHIKRGDMYDPDYEEYD